MLVKREIGEVEKQNQEYSSLEHGHEIYSLKEWGTNPGDPRSMMTLYHRVLHLYYTPNSLIGVTRADSDKQIEDLKEELAPLKRM